MPAIQLMTVSGTGQAARTAETSGVKTQKLQGLQGAFSNYMHQNSSNTAQAAVQQQNTVPAAEIKAQGQGSGVQQQYEQCQSKSAAQADKVSSSEDVQNADAETVTDAVEEAVEDMKEIIKENLGVDDEQIEAAMQLLGLTGTDLLNPQQLTALAAQLTGSEDAGMMLFHENFQQVLQETTAVTENLLEDLGMTMDELMAKISDTQNVQTQPQETVNVTETGVQEAPAQEIVQQVPQQETRQQVPQETEQAADTARTETTHAAETVQVQKTAETEEAQPQQVQVQEEEQPEQKQVQQAQPQQEQSKTGEEETADDSLNNAMAQKQSAAENPHMDFTANVHHAEPAVQTPQAPQNVNTQAPLPQIPMQEVIDQIVEYTKINLSEDVKSIEMQLNPENLGKVYLHVSEKQGTVTAQLTAQNENIKEALVQQAAILKDTLNQQGIKVDAVEVSAGAHEFESNLERDAHSQEEQARQQEERTERRSRRSINLGETGGISGMEGMSGLMSEEEMLVARIMRDNGNNVDFKA